MIVDESNRNDLSSSRYFPITLNSQLNKRKICPKKIHNVVTSYTNTGSGGSFNVFSGQTTLSPRLDFVCGMRVTSMLIRGIANFTITGGWQWTLSSQKLSSLLADNPFLLNISSTANVAPSSITTPVSSIIGISAFTDVSQGARQYAPQYTVQVNEYMPFNGIYNIDAFDWQVGPLNGTWNFGATYTISFMIEFFHECQCANSNY